MVDTKLRGLIGDKDNYTILLSHRPELFEAYVNCGVDLVLSGHAHGGQFRLPFYWRFGCSKSRLVSKI